MFYLLHINFADEAIRECFTRYQEEEIWLFGWLETSTYMDELELDCQPTPKHPPYHQ
jgi:hypothetical protein